MPSSQSDNGDRVQEDLACPLCNYSLRGLQEPRCPECGYRFTWEELIQAQMREHPFAFDASRSASIWNLLRTCVAAFLPGQLWTTLKPSHQIRIKRLFMFILLMWVPLLAVVAILVAADIQFMVAAYHRDLLTYAQQKSATAAQLGADPAEFAKMQQIYGPGGTAKSYAEAYWGNPSLWTYFRQPMWNRSLFAFLAGLSLFLFFPVLLVFQWSMRSRQIRCLHVLRCFAYANSAVALFGLVLAALGVLNYLKWEFLLPDWLFSIAGDWPLNVATAWGKPQTLEGGFVATALLMGFPLWMGYRRYFRFDHALLTVVSVQIIVLLCWGIAEVWFFG